MIPRKRTRPKMGVRISRDLEVPAHRAFVRRHNCSVPGCYLLPIEAAHFDGPIPYEDRGGMKVKDHDRWTWPCCRHHHTGSPQSYHNIGWQAFDKLHGISTKAIAEAMWRTSPAAARWRKAHP